MSGPTRSPLDRLTSIRTKLGALVAASVVVAAGVATLGQRAGVPAWLALPITVALALAVTQLLAAGMTAPLREMTAAARRMAAGDHDVRVRADMGERGSDEVAQLARAFTAMAADLAAVDRRRRELVATVSHELRTPLAGLVAVLENLDDGVTPPGPEAVRTALGQAERLTDLVSDLLDLSRLESGAVPLRAEPVDVRALLDVAVAEAGALPRPVTYDVVAPAGLVVHADAARLHQLVANLLDNASRHSPAGGVVRVSAGPHAVGAGEGWVLEVANAGDPIAPADRERVFDRFGTTDPTGGGSGLGLAIARWVAELHGGTLAAVDPRPGDDGARLRAVLPVRPQETSVTPLPPAPAAPVPPAAAPAPPSSGAWSWLAWPDDAPTRPWLLGAAGVVGLLAALLVVDHRPGLGATLVLLAGGAVVWSAHPARRDPWVLTGTALAAALVCVLTLRDATWIGVVACLAATAVVVVTATRARTVLGFVLSGIAWPLAALTGLPWLGRTVRVVSGSGRVLSVVRTAVVAGVALAVFGLLFASADAVFAGWIDVVVPDLRSDEVVARVFVGLAVAGLVLATSYLALRPPRVEPDAPVRRPALRRFEWLVPVLVVDAVFVAFLGSQAAALVGGRDYVERTTGLTYAQQAQQGFGQLVVATLLTVLVVAVAARRAAVTTAADRRWVRGSLGLLCLLTLLVVASAMSRLALYTDAYGLTRLRLVAGTFELWLALVVVGLLAAGVRLRAAWVPRVAVLGGAAVVLALALANPDVVIARTNVERLETRGTVDLDYLSGLSADAVPALLALPETERRCALSLLGERAVQPRTVWGWNAAESNLDELVTYGYAPAPGGSAAGTSSAMVQLNCPLDRR